MASHKVLLVECARSTRETLVAALELVEGLDVHVAGSGFEALKVLPRHRFALIIADVEMPDINGLELVNFVRKNPHYKETPLFIVSSKARSGDLERGRQLGASEYLLLPCEPTALVALVKQHLKL